MSPLDRAALGASALVAMFASLLIVGTTAPTAWCDTDNPPSYCTTTEGR